MKIRLRKMLPSCFRIILYRVKSVRTKIFLQFSLILTLFDKIQKVKIIILM